MATGTSDNFNLPLPDFLSGMIETETQAVDFFNAQSQGTIIYRTEAVPGKQYTENFFANTDGLIGHRDPDDVTDATDIPIATTGRNEVKVPRRIGPVAQTMNAWLKIGRTYPEMARVAGQQIAVAMMADALNVCIGAVSAALGQATSNMEYDNTGQTKKYINPAALGEGLALMGDKTSAIKAWVMTGRSYHDLVGDSVGSDYTGTGNVLVYGPSPSTFGIPVVVTDSPQLIETASPANHYIVLGLTENAITWQVSELIKLVTQEITGQKNLIYRLQGEYSANLGMKGYSYDLTNGDVDPVNATLFTGTNWDKVANSDKDGPGVRIKCLQKSDS